MALGNESLVARKQIAVNKSQWLPKLELGYRRNTETGTPFNGVVVGFSFPLFENRNKVKIAKAQALNIDLQKKMPRCKLNPNCHSSIVKPKHCITPWKNIKDVPVATGLGIAETGTHRRTNQHDRVFRRSICHLPEPPELSATRKPISESNGTDLQK